MSDAWFGGVDDARESMVSIATLHDEGHIEGVATQLVVTRIVDTLERAIEAGHPRLMFAMR